MITRTSYTLVQWQSTHNVLSVKVVSIPAPPTHVFLLDEVMLRPAEESQRRQIRDRILQDIRTLYPSEDIWVKIFREYSNRNILVGIFLVMFSLQWFFFLVSIFFIIQRPLSSCLDPQPISLDIATATLTFVCSWTRSIRWELYLAS